ncbi:MAG: hypothetical protein RML94_14860 [Bacteroidia bacterium]|nr:hypothetical protein [Bacteroidia bacterium]
MWARSACYGLRYRFGASHRATARPTHASRTQRFDVLPCLCIYLCFTLFNLDYQVPTRLKILSCLM